MHQNAVLIHADEALGEVIPLSAILVPNYQKFKRTKNWYHYGAFVILTPRDLQSLFLEIRLLNIILNVILVQDSSHEY